MTKEKMLARIAYMPPLSHNPKPAEPFDIMNSSVMKWICYLPEVRMWIWDMVKQSGAVQYDRETHKWKGAHLHE